MTLPFPSFDAAFAWLAARTNYETMAVQRYDERTYGLDRVHALLDRAGRPERGRDVLQVVGSKGKGSTSVMLDAILRAAGRRTGLFTSPHLVDPRERIRIDGREAPDELVVAALTALHAPVEEAAAAGRPCTFFEIHTAAALLAFRAAGCDAVVLEAGMGGRLDATTAAEACGVALTGVSLDHVQQLGGTVELIAAEKAAAARAGVPLVCGEPVTGAAFGVVARVAAARGADVVARGRDFDVADVATRFDAAAGAARTEFTLVDGARRDRFAVPLLGVHQAANAAVAAVTVRRAAFRGPRPDDAHVRAGLAAATLRARLEVLHTRPLVLVDGAHTPASFAALVRAVRDAVPGAPRVFVVGMARDKDVAGSLAELAGTADRVVATSSGAARAAAPHEIAAAARAAGLPADEVATPRAALASARATAGPGGVVVVTGSLYLCGEVLRPGE